MGLAGIAAALGKILQLAAAAFIGFGLPLCLSVSDVGVFFFAQSLVTLLVPAVQLGLQHTIPGSVGRAIAEGDTGRARSLTRSSFLYCIVTGVIVSAALGIAGYAWPGPLQPTVAAVIIYSPILIAMIVFAALLGIIAELQRAVFALIPASFLPLVQNLGLSFFIAAAFVLSLRWSVKQLLAISLAFLCVALAWGAVETWRTIRWWAATPKMPLGRFELLALTWPNLVAAISFVAASQLDIWVVGLNGRAVDVAHYGVALRIASLMAIPLTVVSLTLLPHIVSNWTTGRRRYLQWMLSLSATVSVWIAGSGFIAFALVGRKAIHLMFGDAYLPAFAPAAILGAGQVAFTAAGVAGYILIVLGKQKLAMTSMLIVGTATVIISIPAMQMAGLLGVACVYATSAVMQGIVNAALVHKHFGLRSYARPINPLRAMKFARTITKA